MSIDLLEEPVQAMLPSPDGSTSSYRHRRRIERAEFRWFRMFAFTVFVVWLSVLHPALGREPTADDYAIWEALFYQDVPSSSSFVLIWHMTEPSSKYDRGVAELFKKDHPEDAEHIAAAEKASQEPQAAIDLSRFPTSWPGKLLDEPTLTRLVGRKPNPTWLLSPAAVENADAVVRLSWPAYSADGTRAYVFACICQDGKGGVWFHRLIKGGPGSWSPTLASVRFITRWENGVLDDRETP